MNLVFKFFSIYAIVVSLGGYIFATYVGKDYFEHDIETIDKFLKVQDTKAPKQLIAKKELELENSLIEDDKILESTNLLDRFSLQEKLKIVETLPSGSPLEKLYITGNFGKRINPVTKRAQYHNGIDLRAWYNTKVHSTADGVVRYVRSSNYGDYGRMVIVYHPLGFETVYAHLNRTKVKVGQKIKKGDIVGLSGNSGRSTGPHLHYEVRYATDKLNPIGFINLNIANSQEFFTAQKKVPWDNLFAGIKDETLKDLRVSLDK